MIFYSSSRTPIRLYIPQAHRPGSSYRLANRLEETQFSLSNFLFCSFGVFGASDSNGFCLVHCLTISKLFRYQLNSTHKRCNIRISSQHYPNMTFHPDSLADLSGRVYIVTGGNSRMYVAALFLPLSRRPLPPFAAACGEKRIDADMKTEATIL